MFIEEQVHRCVVVPEGDAPEPTKLRRIAQPRPERRGDADVRLPKALDVARPRSSPNQGKRLAHTNIPNLDRSDHGSSSTPSRPRGKTTTRTSLWPSACLRHAA